MKTPGGGNQGEGQVKKNKRIFLFLPGNIIKELSTKTAEHERAI